MHAQQAAGRARKREVVTKKAVSRVIWLGLDLIGGHERMRDQVEGIYGRLIELRALFLLQRLL